LGLSGQPPAVKPLAHALREHSKARDRAEFRNADGFSDNHAAAARLLAQKRSRRLKVYLSPNFFHASPAGKSRYDQKG